MSEKTRETEVKTWPWIEMAEAFRQNGWHEAYRNWVESMEEYQRQWGKLQRQVAEQTGRMWDETYRLNRESFDRSVLLWEALGRAAVDQVRRFRQGL